ncbi:MAG: hypothetical protein NTV46_05225, partial [Verrucomicrobia bacterium]|nr:hypothetical protein [Verrucomicrobiota bacterium]
MPDAPGTIDIRYFGKSLVVELDLFFLATGSEVRGQRDEWYRGILERRGFTCIGYRRGGSFRVGKCNDNA